MEVSPAIRRYSAYWIVILLIIPAGCLNPYSAGSKGRDSGAYPAAVNPENFHPGYFVIVGQRASTGDFDWIKDNPDFIGIKKIYSWRALEPEPGVYDFSEIESDLAYLQQIGKRLWLQIKETQYFAQYEPHVPEYMWNDPGYG